MSEGQKDKIMNFVTGASEAVNTTKQVVRAANMARKGLKTVSKGAAKTTKSKYGKMVPVVGPMAVAAFAVTTTYAVGKRSKSYFSQKAKLVRDGIDPEKHEIKLETWSETVNLLTGVDKDNIQKILFSGVERSKAKLKDASKSANAFVEKGKATKTYGAANALVEKGKATKAYEVSRKEVKKRYSQGKKLVKPYIEKGKTKIKDLSKGKKIEEAEEVPIATADKVGPVKDI